MFPVGYPAYHGRLLYAFHIFFLKAAPVSDYIRGSASGWLPAAFWIPVQEAHAMKNRDDRYSKSDSRSDSADSGNMEGLQIASGIQQSVCATSQIHDPEKTALFLNCYKFSY